MQRSLLIMDTIRESELRELFKEFDKNGDGRITREELEVALLKLGERPSSAKVEAMIRQADTDGNGCIEIDEFLGVLRKQMVNPKEEKELREVFNVFDRNQDGLISLEDLVCVMTSLGEQLSESDARDMIRQGDMDRDGMIDFQEFILLIKNES